MTWLSNYSHRIKITVDSSKVLSDLVDFPIGVTLSSGCGINTADLSYVFDEISGDYSKIAITTSDEETILPVEIEYWNEYDKRAQLWFKAPNVYSTVDTDFYLYYDTTASGNVWVGTNEDSLIVSEGKTAAQLVWESSYSLVYHMNNDPSVGSDCIKDSTYNGFDGEPGGYMLISNLIDEEAIEFDGIDDSIVHTDVNLSNNFMLVLRLSVVGTHEIDTERTSGADGTSGQKYVLDPHNFNLSSKVGAGVSIGTNGVSVYEHGPSYMPALAVYSGSVGEDPVTVVIWYVNKKPSIYINGALVRTGLTSPKSSVYAPFRIGRDISYGAFCGKIYDYSICSSKSFSWIRVNNYVFEDSILTFTEEQPPYTFEGIVSANEIPLADIPIRLYRRLSGQLISSSLTTSSGTFSLCSPYGTEDHYVVALYDTSDKNAVVADWLNQDNE